MLGVVREGFLQEEEEAQGRVSRVSQRAQASRAKCTQRGPGAWARWEGLPGGPLGCAREGGFYVDGDGEEWRSGSRGRLRGQSTPCLTTTSSPRQTTRAGEPGLLLWACRGTCGGRPLVQPKRTRHQAGLSWEEPDVTHHRAQGKQEYPGASASLSVNRVDRGAALVGRVWEGHPRLVQARRPARTVAWGAVHLGPSPLHPVQRGRAGGRSLAAREGVRKRRFQEVPRGTLRGGRAVASRQGAGCQPVPGPGSSLSRGRGGPGAPQFGLLEVEVVLLLLPRLEVLRLLLTLQHLQLLLAHGLLALPLQSQLLHLQAQEAEGSRGRGVCWAAMGAQPPPGCPGHRDWSGDACAGGQTLGREGPPALRLSSSEHWGPLGDPEGCISE